MFSWPEWSQTLGAEIGKLAAVGREDYFGCWLNAVESLLVAKGVASRDELAGLAAAWGESYRTTPHGLPVPAPAHAVPETGSLGEFAGQSGEEKA